MMLRFLLKNGVTKLRFSPKRKIELIQALRKIFDDKDFVLGVLCDLGSDEDIETVLAYIGRHKEATAEDIILLSLNIAEMNETTQNS